MPAWRLKALPNSVGVEKPTVLPISAIVRVNNTTFDYRLHSADASIAAIPEPVAFTAVMGGLVLAAVALRRKDLRR